MILWLRVLMWMAVLVLPGGLLLSPLLLGLHWRRKSLEERAEPSSALAAEADGPRPAG